MPELPEVETIVRDLHELCARQRLKRFEINDARVWFESEFGPEELEGRMLASVSRRGKYIVYDFSGLYLVQHLRMTGKMLPQASPKFPHKALETESKQLRCRLDFEKEPWFFYDVRRFGTMTGVRDIQAFWKKKKQAPDPFAPEDRAAAKAFFVEKLPLGRRPLKSALLDQRLLSGSGNIYADEALHRLGWHPLRSTHKVTAPEAGKLFAELVKIFGEAVKMRGTTFSDYYDAKGNEGVFVNYLRVYQRTGEKCVTCKVSTIKRIVVAGRSTHFCPRCQKKK